jgi:hypothetical protein
MTLVNCTRVIKAGSKISFRYLDKHGENKSYEKKYTIMGTASLMKKVSYTADRDGGSRHRNRGRTRTKKNSARSQTGLNLIQPRHPAAPNIEKGVVVVMG